MLESVPLHPVSPPLTSVVGREKLRDSAPSWPFGLWRLSALPTDPGWLCLGLVCPGLGWAHSNVFLLLEIPRFWDKALECC